ncbi:TPA: hypothetical protein ACIBSG_004755, partial [Salmonella enterica subsp. enterica serovar 4,5,12:b:-]
SFLSPELKQTINQIYDKHPAQPRRAIFDNFHLCVKISSAARSKQTVRFGCILPTQTVSSSLS